jgi:GTP cyclohydrolase I
VKKVVIPRSVREDLDDLLEYVEADERQHFEELQETPERVQSAAHIYNRIRRLRTWLDGTKPEEVKV